MILFEALQALLDWPQSHGSIIVTVKKSRQRVQSLTCAFLHSSFLYRESRGKKGKNSFGESWEQSRDEERALLWGRDSVSFDILILWNASAPLTYLCKVNTQLGCARADSKSYDAHLFIAAQRKKVWVTFLLLRSLLLNVCSAIPASKKSEVTLVLCRVSGESPARETR